jgi:hypothetical protein
VSTICHAAKLDVRGSLQPKQIRERCPVSYFSSGRPAAVHAEYQ